MSPSALDYQRISLLIQQRKLTYARQLIENLLKSTNKNTDKAILYNLLGITYDEDPQSAVTYYQQAILLAPHNPDFHFNIGIAWAKLGNWIEAIKSYQKAIQYQPNFFEAYGNLGIAFQQQGNLPLAEEMYRKGLNIHQNAQGYFNLGTVLRDQGRLAESITAYQQALKISPNDKNTLNNLSEVFRDQGDMTNAVKLYQTILKANPNHANANYNMADFLSTARQFREAIPYFERSGQDDSEFRIMHCLYQDKQFDLFKERLDKICDQKSHTSPFVAVLSRHYAINFNVKDSYQFCPEPFSFVYQESIPELIDKQNPLLKNLLEDIENTEIAERAQGRLHHGKQSAGNLFKRPEASFQTLGEIVKREFQNYHKKYQDQACDLIHHFPKSLEFTSSWYVKMRQGGYLDAHIHEIGWISGAVYLSMPPIASEEGAFEYGMHGDNYPQNHPHFPIERRLPKVGEIILFPSSLFHRTLPFQSNTQRICIAFDLKPDTMTSKKEM